jgi:hypothetical protein
MTDGGSAESFGRPPRGRRPARVTDGRVRGRSWTAGFGAATPREVAGFLITLRPIVARAIEIRRSWIKELGLLFEEARQGNITQVTGQAGRLGRDHVAAFRDVRWSAERQSPPDGCQEIHRALMTWLDGLVSACEALIEVANTGHMAGLKDAQRHVADARYAARRFNGEYARLVAELRMIVRAARRR